MADGGRMRVPGREGDHSVGSSEVHHFCSANPLRTREVPLPTSMEDGGEH